MSSGITFTRRSLLAGGSALALAKIAFPKAALAQGSDPKWQLYLYASKYAFQKTYGDSLKDIKNADDLKAAIEHGRDAYSRNFVEGAKRFFKALPYDKGNDLLQRQIKGTEKIIGAGLHGQGNADLQRYSQSWYKIAEGDTNPLLATIKQLKSKGVLDDTQYEQFKSTAHNLAFGDNYASMQADIVAGAEAILDTKAKDLGIKR